MRFIRRYYYLIIFFAGVLLCVLMIRPVNENSISKDAFKWAMEQAGHDIDAFSVIDTRQYDEYFIVLGHYGDGESACLSSYKKVLFLPIYRRYIFVNNVEHEVTGIGLKLDNNRHIELLLAPPYEEISVCGEDGNFYSAPLVP